MSWQENRTNFICYDISYIHHDTSGNIKIEVLIIICQLNDSN